MKKKIYRLATTLASGIMLASCTFLDVDPTIMQAGDFYKNEAEVQKGLAGVYGVMAKESFYGCDYSLVISNADDLCYQNRNTVDSRPDYFNFGAGDNTVFNAWSAIYEGIKNANEFMEVEIDPKFDPNKIYYAEAKFLRAYYHFLAAQAWGDVPLRKKAVVKPTATEIVATPQSDVLKWCVSEMEECVTEYFKEDNLTIAPSRVTRSTAEGILARVYLFMAGKTVKDTDKTEMYTKAAFWSGEVIARNRHQLNPDYKQVFINMIQNKYDIVNHESMWEVEFWGDRTDDKNWSNGRIGDMIGMQSNSQDDTNFSQWTANYSYAYYNGSLKLWYYYWSTDRTDDENSTLNDTRLDWNLPLYNYSGTKKDGVVVLKASYDPTPYGGRASGTNTFTDPTVAGGVRNAGKWRREAIYEGHAKAKSLYTRINFPLLRYSDVLLMHAEAINELGAPTQKAYDCVKAVRDRAQIKTKPFGDYADQGSFRDLVRNERARELAFEATRKYDLIRWGALIDEVRRYKSYTDDPKWGPLSGHPTASAVRLSTAIQPKHIYLPIPTIELGANTSLKQNPMW